MNATMFGALLRKDFRVYRVPTLGLIVSGAVVYAVGIAAALWVDREPFDAWTRILIVMEWSGILGMFATGAVATTFGGMAFAAERKERTADFVQLMPVGRTAAAMSKLLVAMPLIAACFAVHLLMVIVGTKTSSRLFNNGSNSIELRENLFIVGLLVAGTAMAVGCAWLASSFLKSAAISACIGGAVALMAFIAFQYVAWATRWPDSVLFPLWFAIAVACGVVALVAGTVIFVRRVEP